MARVMVISVGRCNPVPYLVLFGKQNKKKPNSSNNDTDILSNGGQHI